MRCWGWAVEFMSGGGEEVDGGKGEEGGDRYTEWVVSKYKYAK